MSGLDSESAHYHSSFMHTNIAKLLNPLGLGDVYAELLLLLLLLLRRRRRLAAAAERKGSKCSGCRPQRYSSIKKRSQPLCVHHLSHVFIE